MDGHAATGLLSRPRARAAADGLRMEVAGAADDAALRSLLRHGVMEGAIRVAFEREPTFATAAAAEGSPHATVVARTARGEAVAMGSRAVMDVYSSGRPARVGYLGQLRVDPAWRGRRALLRAGFEAVRRLRGPDEMPFDVTAVVADNRPARRLLEAGIPGLPTYRPLQDLVTCILPTWPAPRGRGAVDVERGTPDRWDAIVACLDRFARRHELARLWSADTLRSAVRCPGLSAGDFFLAVSGGQVIGCVALWNQSSFKQVVVRGYAGSLARWRPLINAGARLVGAAVLPPPGSPLPHASVSHVAVDGDDVPVFQALLAAARREAARRALTYVITGFAADHPLLAATRGARRYPSVLYSVHWEADVTPPAAGRVHPEVALL